jgi:hypothetical protein
MMAPSRGRLCLGGVDPAREYWLLAAVYGGVALAVAVMFESNLSRKHYVGVDRPRCNTRRCDACSRRRAIRTWR